MTNRKLRQCGGCSFLFALMILASAVQADKSPYDWAFVRPAIWISETFTSAWMDRGLIDGILHGVSRVSSSIGGYLRNYFDLPVINRLIGDGSAEVVQRTGRGMRFIQTGRVQQYMMMAVVFAVAVLIYVMVR